MLMESPRPVTARPTVQRVCGKRFPFKKRYAAVLALAVCIATAFNYTGATVLGERLRDQLSSAQAAFNQYFTGLSLQMNQQWSRVSELKVGDGAGPLDPKAAALAAALGLENGDPNLTGLGEAASELEGAAQHIEEEEAGEAGEAGATTDDHQLGPAQELTESGGVVNGLPGDSKTNVQPTPAAAASRRAGEPAQQKAASARVQAATPSAEASQVVRQAPQQPAANATLSAPARVAASQSGTATHTQAKPVAAPAVKQQGTPTTAASSHAVVTASATSYSASVRQSSSSSLVHSSPTRTVAAGQTVSTATATTTSSAQRTVAAVDAAAPATHPHPFPQAVEPIEVDEADVKRELLSGIERDLLPWTSRGISLEAILATANRRTSMINERTPFSDGLFVCTIINNRVYLRQGDIDRGHFVESTIRKIFTFVQALVSVASMRKLPDVSFVWTVWPNPLLHDPALRFRAGNSSLPSNIAPVFSLSKSDDFIDVLMPNMYFGNLRWWDGVRKAMGKVAAKPWKDRDDKVVWRGTCGVDFIGTRTRVEMVARHGVHPKADFAFTTLCPIREWRKDKAVSKLLPPGLRKMRQGRQFNLEIFRIAGYRYQLNLPGAFSGTYSRNLQFVLAAGGVVLQHDDANKFYEFYYSALNPWEHYVPVNTDNFGKVMHWLKSNPLYAAALAKNARKFFDVALSSDVISLYWQSLLEAYAGLQTFKPKLDKDACTCYNLSGEPAVMNPAGLRDHFEKTGFGLHQGPRGKANRDVPACKQVCRLD